MLGDIKTLHHAFCAILWALICGITALALWVTCSSSTHTAALTGSAFIDAFIVLLITISGAMVGACVGAIISYLYIKIYTIR